MKNILILILAAILTGCLKTRAELKAEEADDGELQQQTVAQQRAASGNTATHSRPEPKAPPQAYRFEEYDEQLRSLTGRVDNLENQMSQLNALKAGDSFGTNKEKQAQEQKYQAYEEALKKLEVEVQALNVEVARLNGNPGAGGGAGNDKGKGDKAGAYQEAEQNFNGKKWKEAIVAYQKYRDTSPKGKHYADSTYKIGASFAELGMKDEAKAFFEEVVAKFPKSNEAKKASTRLKSKK